MVRLFRCSAVGLIWLVYPLSAKEGAGYRQTRPLTCQFAAPTGPGRLRFNDREKAAAYAEAIAWRQPSEDALWERLHQHFTEPELVEPGYFIALTFGQQSWLRLLNIDHHQVPAGTSASLAPGFETAEAMAATKESGEYWAKH
jgi:hypothetical protein